jgi:hypothetical protein
VKEGTHSTVREPQDLVALLGSRSRPSTLRAVSASALPHPARRACIGILVVALHHVHPVQAERTIAWPGPEAGRGASPRKSAPASPMPSRTSTARIVWAEEDMIMGDCGVCGRCVRKSSRV